MNHLASSCEFRSSYSFLTASFDELPETFGGLAIGTSNVISTLCAIWRVASSLYLEVTHYNGDVYLASRMIFLILTMLRFLKNQESVRIKKCHLSFSSILYMNRGKVNRAKDVLQLFDNVKILA